MSSKHVYKIIFQNGAQVFEVFARHIYQSDMWGFIEIEELIFGERSQIVVDPGEERLKNEFNGVKRTYIPLQAIVTKKSTLDIMGYRVAPSPSTSHINIKINIFSRAPPCFIVIIQIFPYYPCAIHIFTSLLTFTLYT